VVAEHAAVGPDGPWVLDGHNDLPFALRERYGIDSAVVDLDVPMDGFQTDLPRLRGVVGAQFWSVFVPASLAGPPAVAATLEQIDLVRRLVAAHPADLRLCTTADEVEAAVANGRIASLIGVEGGHCIDESLGVLRSLHALGARYLTLTHNDNVPWADSATDEPVLHGLSPFGREVVGELQRLGMFVDLSHVTDAVMVDALEVATAPVIFSHSSARTLCDSPRNVPDPVLAALAGNGGVCMVAYVAPFVKQEVADWYLEVLEEVDVRGGDRRDYGTVLRVVDERRRTDPPPPCTAADVADHVEHVRRVAGLDHVGLGSDYDGAPSMPVDMRDVTGHARLLEVLRSRGWSEQELSALAHGTVRGPLQVGSSRSAASSVRR
jgi:membrane dipeptidase